MRRRMKREDERTERTYHIIQVNCDCACSTVARTSPPSLNTRCPACGKIVGPMEWMEIGRARAKWPERALEIYRENAEAVAVIRGEP